MITYNSAYEYIISSADIKTKILRIEAIINAYTDSLLAGATTGNIGEYSLDDGQSKIRTVYRGANDLASSIQALEKLKSMYITQYNKQNIGSVYRLSDSKNFKNFR